MSIVTHPILIDKWKSLWDKALDFGTKGTKVAQKLYNLCTKPLFGEKICYLCNNPINDPSFIVHLGSQHNIDFTPILNGLKDDPSTIFEAPTANRILNIK